MSLCHAHVGSAEGWLLSRSLGWTHNRLQRDNSLIPVCSPTSWGGRGHHGHTGSCSSWLCGTKFVYYPQHCTNMDNDVPGSSAALDLSSSDSPGLVFCQTRCTALCERLKVAVSEYLRSFHLSSPLWLHGFITR